MTEDQIRLYVECRVRVPNFLTIRTGTTNGHGQRTVWASAGGRFVSLTITGPRLLDREIVSGANSLAKQLNHRLGRPRGPQSLKSNCMACGTTLVNGWCPECESKIAAGL